LISNYPVVKQKGEEEIGEGEKITKRLPATKEMKRDERKL
jgi:hypothetical protein